MWVEHPDHDPKALSVTDDVLRATTLDLELAAVCEAEHPRLVGMLALYTGDRHVAEELAQDALVRLCQHWPKVREGNPAAWLTTVAMNLGRSMFRRRGAARRALARHGGSDEVVERDDATVLAVREAVAALPRRQREAVIHRHFLGHSVRESAAAMGCAEGTVKSLTHKALAALREAGLDPAASDEDSGPPERGADPPTARVPTPPATTTRRPATASSTPTAGTHAGSTHDHEESRR